MKGRFTARADVGIGPYTPHSIFRPNRRGGYQPPAWPRRQSVYVDQTRPVSDVGADCMSARIRCRFSGGLNKTRLPPGAHTVRPYGGDEILQINGLAQLPFCYE